MKLGGGGLLPVSLQYHGGPALHDVLPSQAPAGVISTVMDSLHRLPCPSVPSGLARAVQLRPMAFPTAFVQLMYRTNRRRPKAEENWSNTVYSLSCLAGGEWPAWCDLYQDGWSIPDSPYGLPCWQELLSCELLTIPACC